MKGLEGEGHHVRQREKDDREKEREREKSTVLTIFREVEVKSSQACNFHNISRLSLKIIRSKQVREKPKVK